MSKESKFIDMVETILVLGATGTVGSEVDEDDTLEFENWPDGKNSIWWSLPNLPQ